MANDIALELIDRVRVASPCSMKWDDLDGDGPVRHCQACDLDVYNFSEMPREEVGRLVRNKQGRLCAGFYRRADGTMITRDCPVGLRAVRRHTRRCLARIAAAVGLLLGGSVALARAQRFESGTLRSFQPFAALSEWLAPSVTPPPGPMVMGDIALPPNPVGTPPPVCGTPANEG